MIYIVFCQRIVTIVIPSSSIYVPVVIKFEVHTYITYLAAWTNKAAHIFNNSNDFQFHFAAKVDLLFDGCQSHVLGGGHNDSALGTSIHQCLDNSEVLIRGPWGGVSCTQSRRVPKSSYCDIKHTVL